MNRIREFRAARGWSLQQLADQAGTSKGQVDKLEKGDRRLTVEWMVRLAKPLGCDARDLMPVMQSRAFEKIRFGEASADGGLIPVRDAAGAAIDHVPRPAWLAHARGAYALYVTDGSMAPMYRPGQLLFINPHKTPRPGQGVAVTGKKTGLRIRELVKKDGKSIKLRQHQPRRDTTLPSRDIAALHAVVGSVEP
ncbi:MAG: LexA family transcriptional regulator [Alphaproteobacteria bacterium]|nr:LexA family transcriptional regulator [Alphaproteobacteria bacterium]